GEPGQALVEDAHHVHALRRRVGEVAALAGAAAVHANEVVAADVPARAAVVRIGGGVLLAAVLGVAVAVGEPLLAAGEDAPRVDADDGGVRRSAAGLAAAAAVLHVGEDAGLAAVVGL